MNDVTINILSDSPSPPKEKKTLLNHIQSWSLAINKDGFARDLLALERTNLAWIRTALSCIALGLVISRVLLLDTTLNRTILFVTGSILISLGLVIFWYSVIRVACSLFYFRKGKFLIDMLSPFITGVVGTAVSVLAFVILFN
jgi:uncharacterized membrane protein YidH (DUF202 family)